MNAEYISAETAQEAMDKSTLQVGDLCRVTGLSARVCPLSMGDGVYHWVVESTFRKVQPNDQSQ